MLKLPKVTLIALTGKDFAAHEKAVKESTKDIEFGNVKIVVDYSIKSIDDWNRKIVYELWRYVDTEYAILFHADGYPINADCWRDEFLQYDYVGAPWPLPKDNFSYKTPMGELVRVGNSVSLRSKKLMQLPSFLELEWKTYYGNTNEDGFLCVHNRKILEENGCKFAPLEVAVHFSKEHEIPENVGIKTFAFHQID